jgi:peptidoglycan/xylan/chitin deacetylase (PgdA/CDA1 family)
MNEHILREQLLRVEDLFLKTTGENMVPLWRSPYGEYNREVCSWAKNYGYLHIGWRQGKTWRHGLDSNDWVPDSTTPGYHTPADFLEKVIALSKSPPSGINGGIMLMHLGTERKQKSEQVHFVIGTLIDTLRAGGYRFVKVSELVHATGLPLASLSERSHFQ